MSEEWISAETEAKEDDFRGILKMHASICKGIMRRFGGPPYLYVDLFAGPGQLQFNGHEFPGSPLIAREVLGSVPHRRVHFERDPAVAGCLAGALDGDGEVHAESCQDGFSRWLNEYTHRSGQYGLIYSDPIRDEIPHELLNHAARRLPRVDILSYVAATQYKRRRGVDPYRPYLADHIAAVEKQVVLIREPIGAWQWTFVLWSNWVKYPEWQRRGFYRLDSDRGQCVLERLNLSERESRVRANDQLPFDDPPYQTYAEYLQHPRFLAVREKVFARAAGSCERCRLRPPRDPHHLRYPPWGEFDVPENIIAICHECHCEIHGKAS